MSNKQIELALVSLVPTYGADLPLPLVELAGSLLALSRHLASTLKADEEIARLYACAHIACERLKITLDLPPIEPRPPIPPRVYKRLHTHLDNLLPRNERRRAPRPTAPAQHEVRALPSRPTPSREAALARYREQPKPALAGSSSSGSHPWVQPVIRHVCGESGNARLAPSVLAGVEYVLGRGWAGGNVSALCAAVVLLVAMRAEGLTTEQQAKKETLKQLRQARDRVTPAKGLDGETFWEGWADVKPKELDGAVAQITEGGWLDADWYKGIADVLRVHEEEGEEDAAPEAQVSRRADTMLQERYDLLSEARRAEYAAWKGDILARIAEKMATAQES